MPKRAVGRAMANSQSTTCSARRLIRHVLPSMWTFQQPRSEGRAPKRRHHGLQAGLHPRQAATAISSSSPASLFLKLPPRLSTGYASIDSVGKRSQDGEQLICVPLAKPRPPFRACQYHRPMFWDGPHSTFGVVVRIVKVWTSERASIAPIARPNANGDLTTRSEGLTDPTPRIGENYRWEPA
jgi:hypothetical protein